ncbi:MAG: cytidylyltransferase domain-containing protein [Dermatophilaceae bacterium]
MTTVRVVVQSRLSSSRLPGKALLTTAGMPLVELVARRAARSGHEVVVATSVEATDERVVATLSRAGIATVRGSLDDVLGRFVAATADLADDDLVVRLTGDNPVADAGLVDELVAATLAAGREYGRVDVERVPEGLGAEVFPVARLREADAQATDAYDREHVTPWLRRTLGEHLFVPDGCPDDIHAYRATVDGLHDYVRVSRLFDRHADPVAASWRELMADLVATVDATGPQAPRREGSLRGSSGVLLDTRSLGAVQGGSAADRDAARRELLTFALDHGVSHLVVGADQVAGLRALVEPALVRRFATTLLLDPRLPPAPSATDDAAVGRALERALAGLGTRSAWSVLVDAAVAYRCLPALRTAVAEGVLGRAGVRVTTTADLARVRDLAGVGHVLVEAGANSYVLDQAARMTTRAPVVLTVAGPPDRLAGAWARHEVSSLLLAASSVERMSAALETLTARGPDGGDRGGE